MIVEESNLRFQMAVLRKILGNDRDMIKTVAGRGYIVVAEDEIGAPVDEIHLPTSHVCEVVASGESYDQQSFDAATPELETPAGAVDLLIKPLRHEKLLAAVQSAVACEAAQAFV